MTAAAEQAEAGARRRAAVGGHRRPLAAKPVMIVGVVAACLLLADVSAGDTLVIRPRDDPPNTAEGVLQPLRGETMEAVAERFGEPLRREAPVGEPPITRWIYGRFVVVFEGRVTLRALVRDD